MRMLRHYQERGLLIPARIDQFSGYRFYTSDQLGTAHLIVQLREAGFSIDAMSMSLMQLKSLLVVPLVLSIF